MGSSFLFKKEIVSLCRDIDLDMMVTNKYSSMSTNRFFWLNILGMIVVVLVLVLGTFKGLDLYTHHGEEVAVPDVKGMMPAEADKLFRDKGLIAKVVSTSYQKNMPSGCILELTPEPGEKVKKGRTIFLTINSINAPLQEVPDVTENSSAREAEAQLITAGFHLTPNQMVNGEMDWVYGVLYNGRHILTGEKIPTGSVLTLQVGNGTVPSDTDNPDSVASSDGGEVNLDQGTTVEVPAAPVAPKEEKKADKPAEHKSKPAVDKKVSPSSPSTKQPARKSPTSKKDRKPDNNTWF